MLESRLGEGAHLPALRYHAHQQLVAHIEIFKIPYLRYLGRNGSPDQVSREVEGVQVVGKFTTDERLKENKLPEMLIVSG